MRQKLRSHLTFANVASAIALFVALATGGAYAANTIRSTDIVDGEVKTPDLATGAVTNPKIGPASVAGGKVLNNSLTGADVNEASFGQVPSALLGGFGRAVNGGDQNCDPESSGGFIPCAVVTRNLPAPARLLLIGRATATLEVFGPDFGAGSCQIGSTAGSFDDTRARADVEAGANFNNVTLVTVTDPLPAGTHSFGIDCQEFSGSGIRFVSAAIAAVAISPS
jgi:hypothetical protein